MTTTTTELVPDTDIDTEPVPDTISILHLYEAKHGDDRIEWNPRVPESVALARRVFADYKSRGYLAYKADNETGDQAAEAIHEFDPTASHIHFLPNNEGG